MITFVSGDILDDDAEAIVNPINCVGVMGKGLALAAKNRWPQMFDAYKAACDSGSVRPGEMWLWPTGELFGTQYVIGFPTKRHWRAASQLQDIEAGLGAMHKAIVHHELRSVAIPMIGCGQGGLDWNFVGRRLVERLRGLDSVDLRVYGPSVC